MKLTRQESEAIHDGARQLERYVRVNQRTGRERGCSVKVGDAFKTGGVYLAVSSVSKRRTPGERSTWIIKLQEVGPWAIPDQGDDGPIEMSFTEVKERLPEKLTWPDEPGTKAGDLFIFHWGDVHYPDNDGNMHRGTYPAVYLEVTSNPVRHLKKGHWWASFRPVGFDHLEYMQHGHGTTTDQMRSLDPKVPLEVVAPTAAEQDRNRQIQTKRRAEARKVQNNARLERFIAGKQRDAA